MNAVTGLGTYSWVDRTGGQLTGAERRSLLRPLARTHAVNAVGRAGSSEGAHPPNRSSTGGQGMTESATAAPIAPTRCGDAWTRGPREGNDGARNQDQAVAAGESWSLSPMRA